MRRPIFQGRRHIQLKHADRIVQDPRLPVSPAARVVAVGSGRVRACHWHSALAPAVAALAAAVAARWWFVRPQPLASAATFVGAVTPFSVPPTAPSGPADLPGSAASGPIPAATSRNWLQDDLGGAQDLKRIFDTHLGNADPPLRHVAGRALGACVPACLPGPGKRPALRR